MDPVGREVDAQQHPGSADCLPGDEWCITGNTPFEEWADLIANYLADNFTSNPLDRYYLYGIERFNWVFNVWTNYPN